MGDEYLSSGDEKTIESATFSDSYYDECCDHDSFENSKRGPYIKVQDAS